MRSFLTYRKLLVCAWLLGILFAYYAKHHHWDPIGWDAKVYWNAINTVRAGVNPYTSGLEIQRVLFAKYGPGVHAFSYVYPPATLPLLRLLGHLPAWLLGSLYVVAVLAGTGLQFWAGWQLATEDERRWLAFLLPFLAFFPGLLYRDSVLGGNLAFVLEGLVMAAAVQGWKRGRWHWYYLAVVLISVFKPPLLTLLAFPVLVGRRQWLPAFITGAAGTALFFSQKLIWPDLFRDFIYTALEQFRINRDFGFDPSGAVARTLTWAGRGYETPSRLVYLFTVLVIGGVLLFTARKMRSTPLFRSDWLCVSLIGVALLNPRLKEYDILAITIPMLLIYWRLLCLLATVTGRPTHAETRPPEPRSDTFGAYGPDSPRLLLPLAALGWLVAANYRAINYEWRITELAILLLLFGAGTWALLSSTAHARASQPAS
jgi:hypothetical protein